MLDLDTLAMIGLAACSWPYWRRNELRDPAPVLEAEPSTWLEAVWQLHVGKPGGLLSNSRLVDVHEVQRENGETGWSATILLAPGGRQTTRSAIHQRTPICAALGLPDGAVSITWTTDRVESKAALFVVQDNPLYHSAPWPGCTLDPETGIVRVGRYIDGAPAHMRLYEPGSGAKNWLVAGDMGSGKTAFLQTLLCELTAARFTDADGRERALFEPMLADGKGGASFPEWKESPGLAYYAETPLNILRMLRAATRMMRGRQADLGAIEWVDDRGRPRRGMSRFDPIIGRRGYLPVIVDEWAIFLKRLLELPDGAKLRQEAIRLALEIAQGGRSLGVGLIIGLQGIGQDESGSATLRQFVSGNVIAFRTKSKTQGGLAFAGGMADADPATLPDTLPDGKTPLQGMCLIAGPDRRATMARTWISDDPYGYACAAPGVELQPSAVEAGGYDLAVWRDRLAGRVPDADPQPEPEDAPALSAVPDAGPSVQERRRALIVEAVGEGPTSARDVFAAARDWPDDIPSSSRTITDDLAALVRAGLLAQPGGPKTPYMPGARVAA